MDRESLGSATLSTFESLARDAGCETTWAHLMDLGDATTCQAVLQQLARLESAERIAVLKDIEKTQDALGVGFYGMLPPQIETDLPVPDTAEAFERARSKAG